MHVSFTGAGRDALDHALSRAPAHLRPAFLAVRDHGCGFVLAAQGRAPFRVPTDRPAIVVVGDDLAAALGPAGFHTRSLRRYLARCRAAVVVASEPVVGLYEEACAWAVTHRADVVVIETRPDREAQWLEEVRRHAPAEVALALATVKPAGRPC